MFEFIVSRQELLQPLLMVLGAVDKKQSLVILSNMLFTLSQDKLWLTGTDLEIEIRASIPCQSKQIEGSITIPAKKLVDIIRSFDEDASPTFEVTEKLVVITQGRSRFKISCLPALDYPRFKEEVSEFECTLPKQMLIHLFETTFFSISQQDVRAYLNGLFLEIDAHTVKAVSMDGHRMALCAVEHPTKHALYRLLLPRKSVQELLKLLNSISDETVSISVGKNHFKLLSTQFQFTSKLIDTQFPAYSRVIPRKHDKQVIVDSELLKKTLSRIIILAPEKSRGVLLHIQPNQLTFIANNQEREEATESVVAQTDIEELKIGMNASYLIDLLQHTAPGPVRFSLLNPDSSILIEPLAESHYQYVLMPLKI